MPDVEGRVRKATLDDAGQIAEIYEPIVLETSISFELEPVSGVDMADRIASAKDPWLVFDADGVVAGYAYASEFRSRPAYSLSRESSVYVHPGYQRSGVARTLMAVLLEELASRGVRMVIAGVTLPNPGSVALHESLGFVHVGTFHEVGRKFDRWHDVGFWEKRLQGHHVIEV